MEWKDYAQVKPDLTGFGKTIQVRPKAHSNFRTGKIRTYEFDDPTVYAGIVDNIDTYVPSAMMSIYAVSSQASEQNHDAKNLIDGDVNTSFYTNLDGSDNERFVIIELEQPIAISRVRYYPDTYISYKLYAGSQCERGNSSDGSSLESMTICGEKGSLLKGQILGSNNPTDESSWQKLLDINVADKAYLLKPTGDIAKDIIKTEFMVNSQDKYKYIKFVSTGGSEDAVGKTWLSGRMIQLFQTVKKDAIEPIASIEYSNTGPTNGNVTARVANVMPLGTVVKAQDDCTTDSGEPVIVGEDGKSFTFSSNGECSFDLEYKSLQFSGFEEDEEAVDDEGVTGVSESDDDGTGAKVFKNKIKAKVSNINKVAPQPVLKWSENKTVSLTNQPVSVDLEFSSETPVLVYNNGTVSLNEKGQPVRDLDGTLISKFMNFKVQDSNDPDGAMIDAVIDPTIDISEDTSANVIQKASDVFHYDFMTNAERVIEYIDQAGNKGSVMLKVDNIDNVPPVAVVEYSTSGLTEDDVEARLKFYGEEADIEKEQEESGVRITEIVDADAEGKGKVAKGSGSLTTDFASANAETNKITFTGNGRLKISYVDEAGNVGETEAKVDYIAEGALIEAADKAGIEVGDKKIKKVAPGTSLRELNEKLKSDYPLSFSTRDDAALDVEKDGDKKVGTGMKAGVYGNNYTVIVERDVDGNGEVDEGDVRRAHEHFVEKNLLATPLYEAIDLDENNEISLIDIAKLHHGLGVAARTYKQVSGLRGSIRLESDETEITEGEQISVKVALEGASELNALAAKITQSGGLKLVGCESGGEGWIVTCHEENSRLVTSRANVASEDVLPVTLRFETTTPGKALVELQEVKLASNDREGDGKEVSPAQFMVLAKQTVGPNEGQEENQGGDNDNNGENGGNSDNSNLSENSSSGDNNNTSTESGARSNDFVATGNDMIALNTGVNEGDSATTSANSNIENDNIGEDSGSFENENRSSSGGNGISRMGDENASEHSEDDQAAKTAEIILIVIIIIGLLILVGWRLRNSNKE